MIVDTIPYEEATRPLDDRERYRLERMQHRPALGAYPEQRIFRVRRALAWARAEVDSISAQLDELERRARARQ